MARSPVHRAPDLRLQWPRYVGGALDGEDCPLYTAEVTDVRLSEPTKITEADPVRDVVCEHHYLRRRVGFAVAALSSDVDDRSIDIIVYAAPDVDAATAAWRILVELTEAAGLEAAP